MTWIEITGRVLVSYLVLLIMARFMGKVQLSQLTFFNYVTGITIGSMAATLAIEDGLKISHGIYSLILWASLTVLIEYITLKSSKARKLIDGIPNIIIKHGELIDSEVKKTKINMDEINMLLRKQNVFNIQEVDYAILENNGELTVLKKPEYQSPNKNDLHTTLTATKNLPTVIITKGKIYDKNLKDLNLNLDWLNSEIKKKGYKNTEDIYYAELETDGQLFILPAQIRN
jgi:uncharacterized membrane protein YcaP (DUF421 family)